LSRDKESLDDVAVAVVGGVVGDRSSAGTAPAFAVCGLVALLRDHGLDPARAQQLVVAA
jgi:hypothetical protein